MPTEDEMTVNEGAILSETDEASLRQGGSE